MSPVPFSLRTGKVILSTIDWSRFQLREEMAETQKQIEIVPGLTAYKYISDNREEDMVIYHTTEPQKLVHYAYQRLQELLRDQKIIMGLYPVALPQLTLGFQDPLRKFCLPEELDDEEKLPDSELYVLKMISPTGDHVIEQAEICNKWTVEFRTEFFGEE